MLSRSKGLGAWLLAAGGAAIGIASQTGPDEVASHLSKWLKLLGVDRVPTHILWAPLDTAALSLSVVLIGMAIAWLLWDFRKPFIVTLPLSITGLGEPHFHRLSGLPMDLQDRSATREPPMLTIGETFISNTSTDRAITLEITLRCKRAPNADFQLDNRGKNSWAAKLGEADRATRSMRASGLEPPRYILSPVTIPPQGTVHGTLAFVANMFMPDQSDDNKLFNWFLMGTIGHPAGVDPFSYELEITDKISKMTVTIPLPSPGYP